MILVISSSIDLHARTVLELIDREGGEAALLDLSYFPRQIYLSMDYGRRENAGFKYFDGNGLHLDLSNCQSIWWRRPQPLQIAPEISNPEYYSFTYNEAYEAISGLWLALDAFWINHPIRNEEASRKVFQLKLARDVGLEIPATLITNNPDEARRFASCQSYERTIYKPFSATEQQWRETRLLRAGEVDLLESVRFTPVIFQEYIPAKYDLRVTIVGQDVFPAAIFSQETAYQVDFRMDLQTARIEPVSLPEDLIARLRDLMKRLGLVYGAIDLRLTPDGKYVFLEINPAGQWLFIEEQTAQPISHSLATLLMNPKSEGNRQD